ncbi:protein kinase [Sulfurimonas sp. SAG-AH-194-I05]|nr:Sel1-like repeat-containing protein kinase family protein [Sulfurimonas sp. SAG-AH-194-I05]MDF1874823.1 protein kinase [Sulfurimonas sp. SAG-AH-194-I05]
MVFTNSSKKPIQIDNYTVIKQLGRGGFGTVYHVKDTSDTSKEYALKFLHNALNMVRIKKQLMVLELLNNSELFFRTYLSKKVKGNYILLMEHTKDSSLAKIVKNDPIRESTACLILSQMLSSLEYLQDNEIIHGDIKAENIMKKENQFYLIDYDIVKLGSFTKTLHIQGDDDFTAPEIYKGIQTYASDIYSLGCTLFHMLSGEHIYGFDTSYSFAKKMFAHLYIDAFSHVKISKKMFYIIKRMTDKNHKTRANIDEIKEILNYKIHFDKALVNNHIEDCFSSEYYRYEYMAKKGVSYAQNIFGLLHEDKEHKNFDKALYWYTLAANQELAKAQFNVALCYKIGKGCDVDYEKAMRYFTYASKQKHNRSYFHIADMYAKGLGVVKDLKKAYRYYKQAASNGYKPAYAKLQESKELF